MVRAVVRIQRRLEDARAIYEHKRRAAMDDADDDHGRNEDDA